MQFGLVRYLLDDHLGRPLLAYSVEKLFRHHFKQNFGGHQTPTRVALVDCKASYEVSVFEELVLQQPQRVFQQNTHKAGIQMLVEFTMQRSA